MGWPRRWRAAPPDRRAHCPRSGRSEAFGSIRHAESRRDARPLARRVPLVLTLPFAFHFLESPVSGTTRTGSPTRRAIARPRRPASRSGGREAPPVAGRLSTGRSVRWGFSTCDALVECASDGSSFSPARSGAAVREAGSASSCAGSGSLGASRIGLSRGSGVGRRARSARRQHGRGRRRERRLVRGCGRVAHGGHHGDQVHDVDAGTVPVVPHDHGHRCPGARGRARRRRRRRRPGTIPAAPLEYRAVAGGGRTRRGRSIGPRC